MLDAMCATGVRAVRFKMETGAEQVIACDRSRLACELTAVNASRNDVQIDVVNKDALAALALGNYDYVDLDPYGTPVRYIMPALLSLRNGGVLGVTATDTAMLCGSVSGSERRYLACAHKSPFMHETGIRILLGYIVRQAASVDLCAAPILSYSADHYFRIYVRVFRGASRAREMLKHLGFAFFESRTGRRGIALSQTEQAAGPLWAGPLHDETVLRSMRVEEHFSTAKRMERMLSLWREEQSAPPLYYTLDELSAYMHGRQPKMKELTERFRGLVFRTHFDPKGFKTALTLEEIASSFKGA